MLKNLPTTLKINRSSRRIASYRNNSRTAPHRLLRLSRFSVCTSVQDELWSFPRVAEFLRTSNGATTIPTSNRTAQTASAAIASNAYTIRALPKRSHSHLTIKFSYCIAARHRRRRVPHAKPRKRRVLGSEERFLRSVTQKVEWNIFGIQVAQMVQAPCIAAAGDAAISTLHDLTKPHALGHPQPSRERERTAARNQQQEDERRTHDARRQTKPTPCAWAATRKV